MAANVTRIWRVSTGLAYASSYETDAMAHYRQLRAFFTRTLHLVFDETRIFFDCYGPFCSTDIYRHTCIDVVACAIDTNPLPQPPEPEKKRYLMEFHLSRLFTQGLLGIAHLDIHCTEQERK